MEETVPAVSVPLAPVVAPKVLLILLPGVQNIAGTKIAANALLPTKVEEIPTLPTITPTAPSMLDFGKSTTYITSEIG